MQAEPPYSEAAEPERLRAFISELEADGFQRIGDREWQGPTRACLLDGGHTESKEMTVRFRPSWPYLPPLLEVPDIAAWHADQDRLCIWHGEDNSQRWTTLQGLYDRIDEWAESAQDGFAAVENARNPEIYWQQSMVEGFALVDIDELLGSDRSDGQHGEFHFSDAVSPDGRTSGAAVDLHSGPFSPLTLRPSWISDPHQARGRWFFRTSIPHPPRDLDELTAFLTDKQRTRLQKDLRDRQAVMFGLFWPNQAGPVGTMVLSTPHDGGRAYRLIALRPKGRDAMLLRAGPDAKQLQGRRVAILGVGAIGSHVAEELARAGVGYLLLVDYDLLWPVNLVRHAAPPGTPAGIPKAIALRDHLSQYPWVTVDVSGEGIVWTIDSLSRLFQSADIVIDATGHAGFAELAARVGDAEGKPYVSVALFRGGAVARVRRQALADDTPLLQRPHLDRYPEIPPLDEEAEYVGTETGCLAQVHNAPPPSVAHAAVLAAEVVVDFLTGRCDEPDEVIEVLRKGEVPFHRLGRVRPEDLPRTVDVSEQAQHKLRRLAEAALPNESGGVLVGCMIDDRPVVTEVIEIHDETATDRHYLVPEDATANAVAAARERDSRLGYLGEWHSHPAGSGPSTLDVAAMLGAAEGSGTTEPVLILVAPTSEMPATLTAYVTTPAGLKDAAICTTGDLPAGEPTHAEAV
ncbi:MAG TPA: ThiF family adenylyltransferase [Acidimicrobiales bacterium]|nr:ThiF family adenylyltransferase [Acidimicrobiales bacterium]